MEHITEPLIAYRAWSYVDTENLIYPFDLSANFLVPWKPFEAEPAICIMALQKKMPCAAAHVGTGQDCMKGYHAYKSMEGLINHLDDAIVNRGCFRPMILGTVSLWGHVIEHDTGYRAEFAYPQKFFVLNSFKEANYNEQKIRDLANTYGVEVEILPTENHPRLLFLHFVNLVDNNINNSQ